MTTNQDPIKNIALLIETKSAVKQKAYRNLCKNFKALEKEARSVVRLINSKIYKKDKDIVLSVNKIGDHEFHVHVAGDLLIFILHTNIIVMEDTHGFSKSNYVKENVLRKYLGQINVYNFMADSLKYHRLNDPGYLIARLFCNYENYFLVEGDRQLNYLFENVSHVPITKTDLNILVQLVINQCIESDLITASFPSLRIISLNEKLEKSQDLGSGYKIGFQMTNQQIIE
jgi:hypothetical protein